jgi:hypothetical protein
MLLSAHNKKIAYCFIHQVFQFKIVSIYDSHVMDFIIIMILF